MQQYRDVVITGIYGHMNIEHFMLQDFSDIRKDVQHGKIPGTLSEVTALTALEDEDGEISIESANDYLIDLRDKWADLPKPPKGKGKTTGTGSKDGKKGKSDHDRYLDLIGGEFAEKFSVSQVGASIVPNYYSALRIYEYNITGLDNLVIPDSALSTEPRKELTKREQIPLLDTDAYDRLDAGSERDQIAALRVEKETKRKHKKPKKIKFKIPDGPDKTTPPGPGYSPQPLTLLGYTQYFANLTYINNDFHDKDKSFDAKKWRHGKHVYDPPTDEDGEERMKPKPRPFSYQIEYDTFSDKIYELKDLTVRSYMDLARRIGESKKASENRVESPNEVDDEEESQDEDIEPSGKGDKKKKGKKGKKGKKKKHHKHKGRLTKVWTTFLKRAFVNSMSQKDIKDQFGSGSSSLSSEVPVEESKPE